MNVTFERFNALGIQLDTEQLLLWQYVYEQLTNPDANIYTIQGIRYVQITKEAYYKRYNYFGDKSNQWFGAMLRAMVKKGVLKRLEERDMYCLGSTHYTLMNQREPQPSMKAEVDEQSKPKKEKKKPLATLQERRDAFLNELKEYYDENRDKLSPGMMNDFYKYWTQVSQASKKFPYPHMKFEAEEFFSIGHRIGTWRKNQSKFNQGDGAVAPAAKTGSI